MIMQVRLELQRKVASIRVGSYWPGEHGDGEELFKDESFLIAGA